MFFIEHRSYSRWFSIRWSRRPFIPNTFVWARFTARVYKESKTEKVYILIMLWLLIEYFSLQFQHEQQQQQPKAIQNSRVNQSISKIIIFWALYLPKNVETLQIVRLFLLTQRNNTEFCWLYQHMLINWLFFPIQRRQAQKNSLQIFLSQAQAASQSANKKRTSKQIPFVWHWKCDRKRSIVLKQVVR